MCFESVAWATKQELPAMQKIVLIMLADHNSKTGLCFPSYDTLAKECGMTKRSVINQIRALALAGLLTIEHFSHRTNRYVLNAPASCHDSAPASESLSLGSESLSLGGESLSPKPINKPITKPKDFFSSYPAGAKKNDEGIVFGKAEAQLSLTPEQQEVFDWAAVHSFWHSATISLKTFLHVFHFPNGKLKAQFDAHKKARESWTVLNSESTKNKKSGVTYASNTKSNQHFGLSAVEAGFAERQRQREEWIARHSIIEGYSTHC